MVNLNAVGFVLLGVSVAVWGGVYFTSGPTGFSNMVLLIGVALAATFFSLAWAESYTS